MVHLIIAAHGKLALELVNSAQMVYGETDNVHPVIFVPGEGQDTLVENMKRLLQRFSRQTACYSWSIYLAVVRTMRQPELSQNVHKTIS
ncbi:phosphotransferase system,mannose/fructose/N -acetylgalactosamine-specific component IIB [Actinobacillus equuli]|nr:phosphotransferase system,mannose/fructose/N -acetylgalactosamine-specific component IIB [Actinobacillus equuli]